MMKILFAIFAMPFMLSASAGAAERTVNIEMNLGRDGGTIKGTGPAGEVNLKISGSSTPTETIVGIANGKRVELKVSRKFGPGGYTVTGWAEDREVKLNVQGRDLGQRRVFGNIYGWGTEGEVEYTVSQARDKKNPYELDKNLFEIHGNAAGTDLSIRAERKGDMIYFTGSSGTFTIESTFKNPGGNSAEFSYNRFAETCEMRLEKTSPERTVVSGTYTDKLNFQYSREKFNVIAFAISRTGIWPTSPAQDDWIQNFGLDLIPLGM